MLKVGVPGFTQVPQLFVYNPFMLCIKSHLALTPLLLLSKSNPLRWASIWFLVSPPLVD